MTVPEARLQQVLAEKNEASALAAVKEHRYVESWRTVRAVPGDLASRDVAVVVFDHEDPPAWLVPVLQAEDAASRLEDEGVEGVSDGGHGSLSESVTVPGR